MFIGVGIVSLPSELDAGEPMDCAICAVRLALTGATAGQYNGRGCQLFACVSHFMEPELLILGWADVVIREREEELAASFDKLCPSSLPFRFTTFPATSGAYIL